MTTSTTTSIRSASIARKRKRPLLVCLLGLALLMPAVATAYTDNMGPTRLSPGSYLQTPGAHTFKQAVGSSVGSQTAQACQLRNDSGVNVVDHGNGSCWAFYYGSAYVWGRVYNQGAWDDTFTGWAST